MSAYTALPQIKGGALKFYPLFVQVVCSPGEQDTLRAVSAVPPEQQRLVFGLSSPAVAHYSSQDPLFADLQATQVWSSKQSLLAWTLPFGVPLLAEYIFVFRP